MTDERIKQLRQAYRQYPVVLECLDEIVRLKQVEKDAAKVIKQLSKKL